MNGMIQGTNGHMSIDQLKASIDKMRKPGRPSNELLNLRKKLEEMQQEEAAPAKKPTKAKKATAKPKKQLEDADLQLHQELPPEVAKEMKQAKKKGVKVEERSMTIVPLKMERIEVEVEGLSLLVQHAWDPKAIREMEDKEQGKVTKTRAQREHRDPQAEFNAARYIDYKGRDCAPAVQFKKCIAQVAAEKSLPNVTKAGILRWVYVTSLDARSPDLIPIEFDGGGKGRNEAVLRQDMVRVGNFPNKKATPRYRPSYPNWRCSFRIEYNASVITAEELMNLLNWGGFGIGIAEFRPEKGGQWGRFTVKKVIGKSAVARG